MREIERVLNSLETRGLIRVWARYFARWRSEPVEDVAQEIRVVLFDKLSGRPDLASAGEGYFFVMLKNHFVDLLRKEQRQAARCELYDPASVEYENSTAVAAVDVGSVSHLVDVLRSLDPVLVQALLDAPTFEASGRVNHSAVASSLNMSRSEYSRRLKRLRRAVQKNGEGVRYQMSLFSLV
ncbi:MAG: sigma-70 family RNA polymerase sigma factor [Chloroflexi bacterium]|nr:MAG: sigma-70 family RNA polymerase sigma factor [Chloroflexota bacterium]